MGRLTRSGVHVRDEMTTFIVRVAADDSGELRGIVERVATGLKQRFRGTAEISRIIRDVMAAEREKKA